MTYDHITDQFSKDLSPLAKRMYAVIFEAVMQPQHSGYVAASSIEAILDVSLAEGGGYLAMRALLQAGVIERTDFIQYRFSLSTVAWRAHLRAAQEATHDAR